MYYLSIISSLAPAEIILLDWNELSQTQSLLLDITEQNAEICRNFLNGWERFLYGIMAEELDHETTMNERDRKRIIP